MHLTNDANAVVPIRIAHALNALKTAYVEPSIKGFVLTSSSSTALGIFYDGTTMTEET